MKGERLPTPGFIRLRRKHPTLREEEGAKCFGVMFALTTWRMAAA